MAGWPLNCAGVSLTAASLLLGCLAPASAEKVGVAAAVNPDAFSSLSGTPNKQLNIGKSIFYNERINTTDSGLVQVLLVDGSTFTVGPNSNLVIDRFVYNPRKKTGEIVATFSKGTMRFIGGKLSKNDGGVKVNTPAGVLAIRGGMFQGQVNGSRGKFSFLYGVSLTYKGANGHTQTVYQTGYTLDLTGGTPTVRPTTADDTNFFQKAFSGGGSVVIGGSGNQPANNPPPLTETISLQDLISEATATEIDSTLEKEEQQAQQQTNTNTNTNTPTNNNPPPNNSPVQVETRVLTLPGTYTAFPNSPDDTFTTDDTDSILGGDPHATVDDFKHTFSIVNGRLFGTVSGLTDSSLDEEGNAITENLPDATVNFPATFPGTLCSNLGICLVSDATITQDGETSNYVGRFVGRPGFFAYHVAQGEIEEQGLAIDLEHPEPILAFGGTAHNFGTPSGKVHLFALTPDVLPNGPAPFASAESMPVGDFSVTPLALLEKDSNPESRAVWLQTSLYIGNGDDGYDQQSFVNVALGGMASGGLVGARRGGSHVSLDHDYDGEVYTTRESLAFTGDVATLAGPNGSHFLGTDDPNIVIGLDSTGSHNIGRDIPLNPESSSVENQSGAIYHVGVGLGSTEAGTQQGGAFQGYAVGMVESAVPDGGFTNVVASQSLDDVSLSFDPVTNTLQAGIAVYDVQYGDNAVDKYKFGFGDDPSNPGNRSAYIDDQHFAAIESADGTIVSHQYNQINASLSDTVNNQVPYQNITATSYFVSGEQLNVTAYFPDVFGDPEDGIGKAFCTDCSFMKWGAWGTRVEFDNGESEGSHYVDNVHLGWWIAGEPTPVGEIDALAVGGATATYNGHVIGNVANSLNGQGWKNYVAAGDLNMYWDFGDRAGNLTISNFDGRNFATSQRGLTQPSLDINRFAGSLSQVGGSSQLDNLTGSAVGSFLRGPDHPAQGVGGNFNLKADAYRATGIFAGSRQP